MLCHGTCRSLSAMYFKEKLAGNEDFSIHTYNLYNQLHFIFNMGKGFHSGSILK
jgi:hypothetical protein